MNRDNPQYMLGDGTPRYGIRTTGLVAVAEAPALPVRLMQTAEDAATLDGADLKLALQYRHILNRFKVDDEIIAGMRETHPEELKEAEAVVAGRLGSPSVWMRGARRAYMESVMEQAERDGTIRQQITAIFGSLGISLAGLVVIVRLFVLEVPPLVSMTIVIGMYLAMRGAYRKLDRTIDPGDLPQRVGSQDARLLWADVVNVTFLAVLKNKGVEVDLATSAALTRGWNHTRYAASVSEELRSNHANPARS